MCLRKIMRNFILSILVVFSTSNIAEEVDFEQLIIGTWMESSIENGVLSYQESSYFPDGRKCTFSITKYDTRTEYSYYKTNWFIDHLNQITAEVQLSSSEYVQAGTKFVDIIDELGKNKLAVTMIKPSKAAQEMYFRLPYDRGETICDMVENNT